MKSPTNEMSVAERMRARRWEQDWPRLETGDAPGEWELSWMRSCSRALREEAHATTTVAKAHRMIDALENASRHLSATLSYPPTWKSWVGSVQALVSDPDLFEESCALASLYGPSVRRALDSMPATRRPAWMGQIPALAPAAEQPAAPAPISPPLSGPASTGSPAPAAEPDAPEAAPLAEVTEAATPQEQHDEPLEWIEAILETTRGMAPSQRKEVIDGKVKEQVRAGKGVGAEAEFYWWKDVLFPALSRAEPEQVAALAAAWPDHRRISTPHPERLFDGRFWSVIGAAVKPTREALLHEAIPQMVDTSTWDDRAFSKSLELMLERARDLKGLFEQRLRLWTAIGGSLDRAMIAGEAPVDVFAAPPKTAEAWIMEQGIPEWSSALERMKARPARSMRP